MTPDQAEQLAKALWMVIRDSDVPSVYGMSPEAFKRMIERAVAHMPSKPTPINPSSPAVIIARQHTKRIAKLADKAIEKVAGTKRVAKETRARLGRDCRGEDDVEWHATHDNIVIEALELAVETLKEIAKGASQ